MVAVLSYYGSELLDQELFDASGESYAIGYIGRANESICVIRDLGMNDGQGAY
jgi:hypothetical protein